MITLITLIIRIIRAPVVAIRSLSRISPRIVEYEVMKNWTTRADPKNDDARISHLMSQRTISNEAASIKNDFHLSIGNAFNWQYDLFVQWVPIRLLRGVFPFDFAFDQAGGLLPPKSNGNIGPKPHSTQGC